ncbi:MAG: hypothetical protein WA939_14610 [Nodosilinea sp.]
MVERRVVGATEDRSGVAHLQVDDRSAPRNDVDEDNGPSQQEHDSEDAAPDGVFLASEYVRDGIPLRSGLVPVSRAAPRAGRGSFLTPANS